MHHLEIIAGATGAVLFLIWLLTAKWVTARHGRDPYAPATWVRRACTVAGLLLVAAIVARFLLD